MNILVATDLDGTVVFSERNNGAATDLVSVDESGRVLRAAMTSSAYRTWAQLARTGALVPVTTRSTAEYQRLRLPGSPPRFALVCNGARLLVDGVADAAWDRSMRQSALTGAAPLDAVRARVGRTALQGFAEIKTVEGFFIYVVAAGPTRRLADFADEARLWTDGLGWRVSHHGRRVYLLPAALDKAQAVSRLATLTDANRVIAGGDSILDEGMLLAADLAIRPAHGELHSLGFRPAHCHTTSTSGASAGEDILHWYTHQLAESIRTTRR